VGVGVALKSLIDTWWRAVKTAHLLADGLFLFGGGGGDMGVQV